MKTRSHLVVAALVSLGLVTAVQAASSQLSASVTGTAVDKPIVVRANADGGVTVSAAINGTFDVDPVPVVNAPGAWVDGTSSSNTTSSSSTVPFTYRYQGNDYTGTKTTVTTTVTTTTPESRTVTETVTNYVNKKLVIDGVPQDYTGAVAYSKNYAVGAEGSNTITVTVTATQEKDVSTLSRTDTQTKTVVTTTTAITYTAAAGSSLPNNLSSGGTTSSTSYSGYSEGTFGNAVLNTATAASSSTASGSASYVVDLVAPIATLWPDNSGSNPETSIQQHQSAHIHARLLNGSSGQTYSMRAVLTAANNTTYEGTTIGTCGNQANGIANPENQVWGVQIPCDAPLGQYSVTVYVNSTDLSGAGWPEVVLDGGTITVTPGLTIATQTVLLADFGVSGYGESTSFTATQNKKTKAINTNPGSFHISTTLTTSGPCAGFGTFAPTSATLTLDPNFVFADSGGSPTVHVFVGNAGGSFDLHEGDPLVEVTMPYTTDLVAKTVTVDLSPLGIIPSTYSIYIRAHYRYSPIGGNLPNATTSYSGFSSSANADVGPAPGSSATQTYTK